MGELLRKHINSLSSTNSDYRVALNVLIKYEIQCLLERLSSTGEEAVVITTSVDVGCPGFLGSVKGEKFIEENKTVTLLHSQLINYCKDGPGESVPGDSITDTSCQDDQQMDTGPDRPGSDHVTSLPSNRHVVQLPSNHHVTSHRDDHVTELREKHINTTLNKKLASKYSKDFSWEEEKITLPVTMATSQLGESLNNVHENNLKGPNIKPVYPFSEFESKRPSGKICGLYEDKRDKNHLKFRPDDGNSYSSYNGFFDAKSECIYKYPVNDESSDDNQALDYSMPSSQTASKLGDCNDICEDLTLNKCCKENDEIWFGKSSNNSVRAEASFSRKAYPFLTRELFFSGKAETVQSGDVEDLRNEHKGCTDSATASVEEINSETSSSILNDLYLPMVKTEPSEDMTEMSDMQFMCASRLLRHTELPSSPLQMKFTCKTCGEVFKNRQFRDLHVKLHKNAQKFACTVCGVGFDVEDEYQAHQRVHCEPLLVCQDCGYRCTREFRMKSHREICGAPSKIYKCPFCNKPFAAKRYMNIHMKSHDVRNINPCPFCPNVYPLKNSLLKHIKKKHGVGKLD